MFVGRLSELGAIDKGLVQAKGGNPSHILILGERGIGKTSLLNVVAMFAKGQFEWDGHKHDFAVARVTINEQMTLVDFAKGIRRSIEREGDKESPAMALAKKAWGFLSRFEVMGVSYKEGERPAPSMDLVQELIYGLVDTVKALTSPSGSFAKERDGLVLILDEADKCSPTLGLGTFLKTLTEALAAEGSNHLLIVIAGLPTVRNVLLASHPSSLRLFNEFTLAPLSPEDMNTAVERGLREALNQGTAMTIGDDAKDRIAMYSEGYPHFIQQVAYSAFEADADGVLSAADVDAGALGPHGAIAQIGDRYYVQPFYTDIKVESQREILTIMAGKWNDWITKADIRSKFSGNAATLDNGLRALKEKGTIIPRDGAKGQYRLQWASFAFWIRTHERSGRR